jgi:hypothetical protein
MADAEKNAQRFTTKNVRVNYNAWVSLEELSKNTKGKILKTPAEAFDVEKDKALQAATIEKVTCSNFSTDLPISVSVGFVNSENEALEALPGRTITSDGVNRNLVLTPGQRGVNSEYAVLSEGKVNEWQMRMKQTFGPISKATLTEGIKDYLPNKATGDEQYIVPLAGPLTITLLADQNYTDLMASVIERTAPLHQNTHIELSKAVVNEHTKNILDRFAAGRDLTVKDVHLNIKPECANEIDNYMSKYVGKSAEIQARFRDAMNTKRKFHIEVNYELCVPT